MTDSECDTGQGIADAANIECESSEKDRRKRISQNAELFFGIVGAVGTDLKMVELALSDALREVSYSPTKIRLSDLIEAYFDVKKSSEEYLRIKRAMDLGNQLRKFGNDSVALLGMVKIGSIRDEYWRNHNFLLPENTKESEYESIPIHKHAYIFHSLKHPDEIETLRSVYGDSFYVISAYSARADREAALQKRIAESEIGNPRDNRVRKTNLLMRRDFIEADLPNGQNVRDTFALADVFVNTSKKDECAAEVQRFVRLIFGDATQTPTRDEYCMFHAKGAAIRSGDLGRQVGATIATENGDVVSHGSNEAPKAYGGQFWIGDKPDGRGVAQDGDISDERKRSLFIDLLERLVKGKKIEPLTEDYILSLAGEIFSDQQPRWIKGAELLELIGFYRSVHGETAALLNAARLGIAIKDCNLYVTAFPCHECARHILAAGIKKVFYVEPYPKSLAGKHYPESIVIDGPSSSNQISFCQFVGVSPRLYMKVFESLARKNKSGTAISWVPSLSKPRYHSHWLAYIEMEVALVSEFQKKLKALDEEDSNGSN